MLAKTKRCRKAATGGAILLVICVLIFAGLLAAGVFQSRDIISVSVTYDADPYNEGKSDPHTYAVTDEEDIAFLEDTLRGMKPLMSGGNCPFKQIVLHVTYADKREINYYPACDSCNTIAANDPDSGGNHFQIEQISLYEFRQRISRYIPALTDDGNWWMEALG